MTENLIKSADRVKDHGEVFTPRRIVNLMLDQPEIAANINDLYATFLEPSAGKGDIALAILKKRNNSYERRRDNDFSIETEWMPLGSYADPIPASEYLKADKRKERIFAISEKIEPAKSGIMTGSIVA